MKVSTKKDKNAAPVVTNLNVTWDSPSAERALALQALVVKLQGTWRKGTIPADVSVSLSDYAPGTRHTGPVDVMAEIKTMSKEERAKLLKELQEQE